MNRLIDQIQIELQNKNLLGEVTHICLTPSSLEELSSDFKEEFELEYMDLGRDPSKRDIEEYLNAPILIENRNEGEKYSLLTKI